LQYRWAALTIRKRAHDCREWSQNLPSALKQRKFLTFQAVLRAPVERLQGVPGVYLTRRTDERNLYLGETFNLGQRFHQHLQSTWREIASDIEVGVIELDETDPKDRWGLQTRLIEEYTPELNYRD
jgi:excinuclease UvrABC nuclease subunit